MTRTMICPAALVAFGAWYGWAAQEPSAVPISIVESGVRATENGATVDLRLRNNTAKPITAYAVIAELFDGSGKKRSERLRTAVMGLSPATRRSRLAGEEWIWPVDIPVDSGQPVAHRFVLDYVLFEDNSAWGPDARKFSRQVAGMRDATRMERRRLRALLKSGGAQAVVQDLEKEQQ